MAPSMATSITRGDFRLTSPSALLCRHRLPPSCLPLISSTTSSSCCRLLSAQTPPSPAFRCFASSASGTGGQANLKEAFDSAIQSAEKHLKGQGQDKSWPRKFPFKIIDGPGFQAITLKQELGNETVEVSIFMGADERKGHEAQDKKEERATMNQSDLSLIVTVEKGSGSILRLCCTSKPDGININSLMLKSFDPPYEGPEFKYLDENLQKGFRSYLEDRGINSSLVSFVQDYMKKKEGREYLTWLKKMKEFIEK